MGSCGYEEALLRLLDIACLTQSLAQAEAAITRLEHQFTIYRKFLQHEPRKNRFWTWARFNTLNWKQNEF
jgi:hypothetical protein